MSSFKPASLISGSYVRSSSFADVSITGSPLNTPKFGRPAPKIGTPQGSPIINIGKREEPKPLNLNESEPTEEQNKILNGYLYGQMGNVSKMGVWWTIFGPLILAIFKGNSFGVGGARVAFNTAMFICSPLAGAIAERVSIKYLLNLTTLVRGIVYVVLLPLVWALFESDGWIIKHHDSYSTIFAILFFGLVFVDGVMVAFANVVDIDCGGADLIAIQYGGIPMNDVIRNKFNSLHEGYFNFAMIVLSPLVALLGLIAANQLSEDEDAAAIIGVLGVLFLITTLISLYFYTVRIPTKEKRMSLSEDDNNAPPKLTLKSIKSLFGSISEGFKICWNHSAIKWRLIFLSLETAFEDAMISLIIAEVSIKGIESHDYAKGNLWANGVIAVGKTGGIIAAIVMHKLWVPPQENQREGFKPLFIFVFLGGIVTLILPLAHWMRIEHGYDTASTILIFFGTFLFFIFSTPPKIGFATLLQSLAADTKAGARIFGFVAALLTTIDSIVLLGLSAIFSGLKLQNALWVSCGLITFHGFFEFFFGPALVLQKPQDDEEQLLDNDNN